ncbi:UNVERIFIED_CONTAM: DNA-directed DNA polymerase alpha subunit pol12 [Siphonaria sp. JEL0065]|nr:DNA-directed DNA polymerase alpha subunit pol12 [Siphonaria sp. JEL0065]
MLSIRPNTNNNNDKEQLESAVRLAFATTPLDLNSEANGEALQRLCEYARVFGVSADALAAKYEAKAINSSSSSSVDATLTQVHNDLVKEMDKRISAQTTAKTVLNRELRPATQVLSDNDLMGLLSGSQQQSQFATQRSKVRVRGQDAFSQQHQQLPRTPVPNSAQRNIPPPIASSVAVHAALQAAKMQTPLKPSSSAVNNTQSPLSQQQQQSTPQKLTAPSIPFKDRANMGKLEEVFGAEVPLKLNSSLDSSKMASVDISFPPGQQMDGYRYMFERLAEKGDLVDERIQELSLVVDDWVFSNLLVGLDDDAQLPPPTTNKDLDNDEISFRGLQNPNIPHQEVFYTAGRIVIDNSNNTNINNGNNQEPTDTTKLTLETIFLETCRLLGAGARVQLQLSESLLKRGNIHFFPGQVIGLSGVNPSGRLLIVQDIFNVPRLEFATSRVNNIIQMYSGPGNEGRVINMMIAAGPFSVDVVDGDGAPSYEPLQEFGKVVCSEKPDVVILCGPFVDEASPGWKGGYTMDSEGVMKRYIVPVLKKMVEASPNTKIVLVPSTRGLESEWVGYPQPPIGSGLTDEIKLSRWKQFGLKELVAAGKVLLVPNPVQLMVNEVVVTVSNVDSLFHLSRDQLSIEATDPMAATKQDRMSRLFQHHLTQRHLYPLSPPTLNPADKDPMNMNLFAIDSTRAQSGAITLQATPDILILPSALKGMVRNVDGCVCVNPGTVVKGRAGGGSFARVCIHPLDVEQLKGMLMDETSRAETQVGEKRKPDDVVASLGEDVTLEHGVHGRCRVEVQKV